MFTLFVQEEYDDSWMNEIVPTLNGYGTLDHILEDQPELSSAVAQGIVKYAAIKYENA